MQNEQFENKQSELIQQLSKQNHDLETQVKKLTDELAAVKEQNPRKTMQDVATQYDVADGYDATDRQDTVTALPPQQ